MIGLAAETPLDCNADWHLQVFSYHPMAHADGYWRHAACHRGTLQKSRRVADLSVVRSGGGENRSYGAPTAARLRFLVDRIYCR